VGNDSGRIWEIVKAAMPGGSMDNLVFVIRQALRKEREEGYQDGYDDGGRDERDARRYEEERAARVERAAAEEAGSA